MKLSELWLHYEQDKTLENYSKKTLKSYRLELGLLIRFLGDMEAEDVTIFHLKNYLIEEQKRLKPSSFQHRCKFIRSFFRWAHEYDLLSKNPAIKVKMPKDHYRIPKPVNEETLELLRIASKSPLEGLLVEFMYSAGVRVGEVYNLNKKDFNFTNRSVYVFGKGDKEREVYFSKRAEIWIQRYFDSRQDEEECFICSKNKPYRRMSIDQIRWHFKKLARKAEVDENVYPHRLRHSYASHLINRGASLEMVRDMLGHKRTETTRVYTLLHGDKRREEYRKYF
ncbi:tyrosine-type recombinase/integrase [Evansella cellulosilytica]|uniref:Integrase family protein n=1 Tax=Evansella cellulosilytica (strain ATCC 21833 / DSM 2522 / FERM P-1141 / JCM 9156 / N-4) TaxID=649639 RepID=E6U1L1_EVAC2|nr:tyrosine-type recombinase/integrase [Evansella cellulosilytica]ADU30374.1 integrase family protein [Evansella cellulosilytica DSM 2522]